MTPDSATDRARLSEVIRRRRTSLLVDRERPVPRELVGELVEAARWAPCHKRTWPWQFAAFTDEGRGRLGDACGDALAAAGCPDHVVAKARTKYRRAPLVLVVGAADHAEARLAAENRDATAAAIQNLLLTATACGLAAFWSTPYPEAVGAINDLCRFTPGTVPVAVIYVGWPAGAVPAPERPVPPVTWIEG
jgi:nitroreductase